MGCPRQEAESFWWSWQPPTIARISDAKRVFLRCKQVFDPRFQPQDGLGWKKKSPIDSDMIFVSDLVRRAHFNNGRAFQYRAGVMHKIRDFQGLVSWLSKIRCFRYSRQLFDPQLKPVQSTQGKVKLPQGYESILRCPKHHKIMGPRKQRESIPIPRRGRAQNPGFSGADIQNPLFSVL